MAGELSYLINIHASECCLDLRRSDVGTPKSSDEEIT